MTKEMIMDIVRTAMKALGGWLLGTHWAITAGLTDQDWQTFTGAAVLAGSLLWSWYSTYHLEKAAK